MAKNEGISAIRRRFRALPGIVLLVLTSLNFFFQPSLVGPVDGAKVAGISHSDQRQLRANIIEDIIEILEKLINPPPLPDEEDEPTEP